MTNPTPQHLIFEFTANPVQKDHVRVVEIAMSFLEYHYPNTPLVISVIPIVSHPYEHKNKQLIGFHHRIEMTQKAFATLKQKLAKTSHLLEVIDASLFMGDMWYTNELVAQLHSLPKHPSQLNDKLFYVVGSDNAPTFHTWKNTDVFFEHANLLIVPRDGTKPKEITQHLDPSLKTHLRASFNPQQPAAVTIIPLQNTVLSHSSTQARNALSIQDYTAPIAQITEHVPQLYTPVLKYVVENSLYKEST